jgi:hypothetical protein
MHDNIPDAVKAAIVTTRQSRGKVIEQITRDISMLNQMITLIRELPQSDPVCVDMMREAIAVNSSSLMQTTELLDLWISNLQKACAAEIVYSISKPNINPPSDFNVTRN